MAPSRLFIALSLIATCRAFSTCDRIRQHVTPTAKSVTSLSSTAINAAAKVGNLHGESACFMPLLQNDEEYIAPRIVQIAGPYPGVDKATYLAVTSEPAAEMGQWEYDFSDPDGPQMGTIALPGMAAVYECEDPVALISDHFTLKVSLTNKLTDPVDLLVLCDRAKTGFAERKFLVLQLEGDAELTIGAFNAKDEIPAGAEILGHVSLVQIPWLRAMEKRKSGFLEEDTLYS